MLTEIRDRSTGWFAGGIAALIIIPMAFWGVQDYTNTDADPVIVKVGEQKITQQAFKQQLSNQQAQALQNNPNLANSDVFSSEFYKRQVLDGMIDQALVREVADKHNYRVGDDVLATYIRDNQLFQTDGEFDQVAYDNYVATRSASKIQFENDVRENTRLYHVQAGYAESALVLPDEVRALLEIQVEQRSFDLITIKQSDYSDAIVVSDADVETFYQENLERFMLPERTSVSYVQLTLESLAKNIDVSDADAEEIYQNDIERYRSEETRETSHILLSTAETDDSEQFAKAQALIGELNAGADFAELAKEHSQDPGSANTGGSLGEINRGSMVDEFDRVAFELDEGVISQVVKTKFGYHIIKVNKIIGGIVTPFVELKEDILSRERARLAQDVLVERAGQLSNLVFEQPESLEGVASELGLEIKTSTLFARDQQGEGVLQYDAVRAAAFSDQVLSEGLNSEAIEVTPTEVIALRKSEYSAPEPRLLADVSAQIKQELTNQRASDAAKQAGDSILSQAKESWSTLADDESYEIASHTVSMSDQDRKASSEILTQVFKTQLKGAASKVVSFTSVNGDFNIIRLSKIAPGDVAKVSTQVKESTRRLVSQRNGGSLFQSYLEGLTEQLKDDINEDLL